MSSLLTKMAIFIVLMVIGYVFARSGAAAPGFTKSLSSLVLNVFICASILNSVLTAQLSLGLAELGRVLLVLSVSLALCYLLSAAICRLLPIEKSRKPYFELLMSVPNNMFIALPVLEQIMGPEAVFYCGLSNIPFNILLYTYGLWLVSRDQGGEKLKLKSMLSAPLVATVAALLIFVFGLPLPQPAKELISSMAGATMPLSMVVIGASLSTVSLLDAFKNWRLYLASFFKLIIFPLFTLAVCRYMTDNTALLATAAIIAASPSGVMVSVLATKYNGDYVFASEGVLQSTALSMVTIPVIAFLLL